MRFSIVTICRNNLNGLIKTQESLKIQSYRDFQWIIIDGQSKDGTPEWLQNNVGQSATWISEPDNGIFSAMNKGLDRTKGEYVIFLNSGDAFADKDVLEKVAKAIDQHVPSLDFIYGDSIDVTPQGTKLYREARDCSTVARGLFTQHQSMFFNVRGLEGMRLQEKYSYAADYAFIGQYLYKLQFDDKRILKLRLPVCIFLLGGFNETNRLKTLKEDFLIRRDCFHKSLFFCCLLWVLHFIHLMVKRTLPNLPRWVRYKKA